MTDVIISSKDIVVEVQQPTIPPTAPPPKVGLVEINQVIQRGSAWMTGHGPPTMSGGQTGDMYLDMDTGDVYLWNGSEWEYQGTFAPATLTAEEILAALITVDGAGSGLDADLLDGEHGVYYAKQSDMDANNAHDLTQDDLIAQNASDISSVEGSAIDLQNGKVAKSGDTMTGALNLVTPPTAPANAASKAYVDSRTPIIADAPNNTNAYGRKALAWVDVTEEAPSDGLGYMRKNGAWTPSSGGATTDDLPPAGPLQDGQFWWKSSTGVLYLWYVEPGDVATAGQWVQVSASPQIVDNNYTRKTASRGNRITNGAMQVSQELGAGNSNTLTGSFVVDQWNCYWSTTGTPAQGHRQEIPSAHQEVDWFFRFSATVADTSLAATEYYTSSTKIEGLNLTDFKWGTPLAIPAVFRMMVRSMIAGTFCLRFTVNSSTVSCFIKAVTITTPGVWTLVTFPIPPCTIGTAMPVDNTNALSINITAAAGASHNTAVDGVWGTNTSLATPAQTNWLSAANQYLEFTNVGLYADPDKTGLAPPFEIEDYATTLAKCQRYWQRLYAVFSGNVSSTLPYNGTAPYPVAPRATPTLSGVNFGNTNFPATTGPFSSLSGVTFWESRTANGTGVGAYQTNVTVNARM